MIIFGSRIYGKNHVVKGRGYCTQCNAYGQNTSYSGKEWGHLYYIPLFPTSEMKRIVLQCDKCSYSMQMSERDAERFFRDFEGVAAHSLAALESNEQERDQGGKPVSHIARLIRYVNPLIGLMAGHRLEALCDTLREKNLMCVHHCLRGAIEEFHGHVDESANAYWLACESNPTDTLPLILLAGLHLHSEAYVDAGSYYEKALAIEPDNVFVLMSLLEVYSELEDHVSQIKIYETYFDLDPTFAQDKKMVKAYKKTCKKAGCEPRSA